MIPIIKQGSFDADVANTINLNFQQAAGTTTGNIVYVDPFNGYDGNSGQYASQALATLASGYNALREGHNDVLALIGNGLTTGTARIHSTFTWSKNAAHLIGVSSGVNISNRSRIAPTGTDTAFANFFVVSGSGCLFQNVAWFHGFNTGTTAAICLTVSGGRNQFNGCDIEGMGDAASAADAGSRNIKISTTGENQFINCNIGLDTQARTNANASVEFASGTARNVFQDCTFLFDSGDGNSLGVKMLTGGGDRFQMFQRCQFINAIKSGGTSMTALGAISAAGGGPNGLIFYRDSSLVGIAEWEGTTKTSAYVAGPAVSSSMGIAVNPA